MVGQPLGHLSDKATDQATQRPVDGPTGPSRQPGDVPPPPTTYRCPGLSEDARTPAVNQLAQPAKDHLLRLAVRFAQLTLRTELPRANSKVEKQREDAGKRDVATAKANATWESLDAKQAIALAVLARRHRFLRRVQPRCLLCRRGLTMMMMRRRRQRSRLRRCQ